MRGKSDAFKSQILDTEFPAFNVGVAPGRLEYLADKLRLDDDRFTAFTGHATVASGELRTGAGVTTAADASDHLIYNTTTGALYYDRDGSGTTYAPVKFAVLSTHPVISAADFAIVT